MQGPPGVREKGICYLCVQTIQTKPKKYIFSWKNSPLPTLKLTFPIISIVKPSISTAHESLLVVPASRKPDGVPSGPTRLSCRLLARLVDAERDDQDASGPESVSGHVDPLARGRLLDGDVAAAQGALLARVEDQSEDALDDDGAVETVDALHGRRGPGGEIHHPAPGSVLH